MTDTSAPTAAVQIAEGAIRASGGDMFHARAVCDALARADMLCPPGTLAEGEWLRAELAAAESTIAVLEDPELRTALTSPTTGDYGPVPYPDAAPAGTTAEDED